MMLWPSRRYQPRLDLIDWHGAAEVALPGPLPFLDRRLLQHVVDLGAECWVELPDLPLRVFPAIVFYQDSGGAAGMVGILEGAGGDYLAHAVEVVLQDLDSGIALSNRELDHPIWEIVRFNSSIRAWGCLYWARSLRWCHI